KALKDLEDMDEEFERFPNARGVRDRFGPRLRALALTWLRIGDLNKAMQFAADLETKPARPPDLGVLGMVLIEKKQYAEAERYFKNRLTPTSNDIEPRE